ncbi:hypothetical protein JOJ88_005127 [Pantoea cypripedii]|nr:hypothetical protein [Pantoea cypripedii]
MNLSSLLTTIKSKSKPRNGAESHFSIQHASAITSTRIKGQRFTRQAWE